MNNEQAGTTVKQLLFHFYRKKTRENKVFDAVHYDVYSLFFFIDFDGWAFIL